MNVLIAIYTHPEFYPPTINAAEALASTDHKVTILCSNNAAEVSKYAENIDLVTTGKYIPVRAVGKRSTLAKVKHWISYTWQMRKLLKHKELIVLYDAIPLLSYRIAAFFLRKKPRIWYHNHDIMEISLQRKYSISWWAAKNEDYMFPYLDIFSLPSEERKKYFPMTKFKGRYIFLPNFPSLRRYKSYANSQKSTEEWRIIFQGSIGPGHGIEEICSILPMNYQNRPIKLLLKGFVSEDFKIKINSILEERNAVTCIEWLGITKYEALAQLTANCHIGIAIFTGQDVMNRTLGTSSNKIYEYAASGVPILYFKNEHFRQYLEKYPWAVGTDLEANSLKSSILYMLENQETLSFQSEKDFSDNLNFENYFKQIPVTFLTNHSHTQA